MEWKDIKTFEYENGRFLISDGKIWEEAAWAGLWVTVMLDPDHITHYAEVQLPNKTK